MTEHNDAPTQHYPNATSEPRITFEQLKAFVDKHKSPEPEPRPTPASNSNDSYDRWPADKILSEALEKYGYEGNRNDGGLWLACQLRDEGYTEDEAEPWLREYAASVPGGGDTYSESEALASLHQAYKRSPREPRRRHRQYRRNGASGSNGNNGNNGANGFEETTPDPTHIEEDGTIVLNLSVDSDEVFRLPPELARKLKRQSLDDEGNAQSVYALFGEKFTWCDAFGWMHYTGTHWDKTNAEHRLERAIVKTLIIRRALIPPDNQSKVLIPSSANVRNTKFLLRSLVLSTSDEFDTDPDQLNCANGVVNLRTGEISKHHVGQRFTYCVPTEYEVWRDWSQWEEWLASTVYGGKEMVQYLQMAIGYSLTGHTSEEVLFYIFGPPRSGKGTFTETILAMLGRPLGQEVDFNTFTQARDGDAQNFDLAPLKPTRIVFASESNKYQALNTARIKAITGGNYIRAAFKHKNFFTYRPQFVVWLSSNHVINADVDDDAMWSRVRVIEFPNSHVGQEDKSLKHRMRSPENLKSVLTWAVHGAVRWYASGNEGLPMPAAVAESTAEARRSQDFVQMFIDECCIVQEEAFVASSALYHAYAEWCKDNGITPKQQRAFSLSLKGKGFDYSRRRTKGKITRVICGIELLDSLDVNAELNY